MRRSILIGSVCSLLLLVLGTQFTAAQFFPAGWNAEYFDNDNLGGSPLVTRVDTAISFDWGSGSPDILIPNDNFSARWSQSGYLPGGTYQFTTFADEDARVIVDGNVIIDTFFTGQAGFDFTAEIFLAEGNHTIVVEYRESGFRAFMYLTWGRVAAAPIEATPFFFDSPPPVPFPSAFGFATVAVDRLNVRSGPGLDFNITAVVLRGQQFGILETSVDGTWLRIELAGTAGWVFRNFVVIIGADAPATTPTILAGNSLVANTRMNIRSIPSLEGDILGVLVPGQVVGVIGRNAGATWWQIADGFRIGWVSGSLVTLSPDLYFLDVPITG